MRKRNYLPACIFALALLLASVVSAAIPQIVTFQGELSDMEGNPIVGDHPVSMIVYDSPEDGTALWQEDQDVTFAEGLFTVQLGADVNDNPLELLFDQQYWLGISVDGQDELSPRMPFTSAPYAFRAKFVDEISQENIQQFWQLAQSTPDFDGDGHDKISMDGDDCDDFNPFVYPGADEYCDGLDNDCDGYVDNNTVDCPEGQVCYNLECVIPDNDGDGWPADQDCDDGDPNVYPGAPEVCNGIDDNCDGVIDDVDEDNDGYNACIDDCDDSNPNVHPGAPELCNGIDDDCNGIVDDNVTDCPQGTECVNGSCTFIDNDGDGWPYDQDCDDSDPNTYPGAPEYCDGIDNDCDGQIDNDVVDCTGCTVCESGACVAVDNDNDGYPCDIDCNDFDPNINPGAPEICDGIDNNCDGQIDNVDQDGDGYNGCFDDCDDTDPNTYPGAPEICGDGIDNNCNGEIDEGC